MGVGDAYLGLVDLLSNNGEHLIILPTKPFTNISENCTDPDSVVECLIGFVAESTIQSIKRATDDTIANWYYAVRCPYPT
jgi:histone deacetylase 6